MARRASPPLVVVTGGKQPGDRFTEAEASAAYLTERGVPADGDRARGRGHSTYESLDGVADAARGQRACDTVLLVTDPYHALRSRLIAEELGLTAYVSPTPIERRHAAASELRPRAASEAGGRRRVGRPARSGHSDRDREPG